MTGFSPRELATAAGVRRHGPDYLKLLSPVVAGPGRDGWHALTVQEPSTGAWQRNMEERATTVLTYPTLYACLNRIASDIGKLPFVLKSEDDNGIWRVEKKNTAYWPVLRKPNGYQIAQQFRASWMLSKLIQGNTYVLKGRDERRVVNRLWVLDPCSVQPMVSDNGEVFYQLNYSTGSNLLPESYPGSQLIVPASEIIHDRMNCFHHQLIGVPPLCAAHWPAVKNLKILKDSTTFFANGANPGGILTAPSGMSDDDAKSVKEYWNTSFQGSNSGKVAVIGADMKFTPFAFKAADSQLVEQMRYSDEQVCQPFGIPPFKIGIGSIPAGMKVDDINQLYYSDALQAHIEGMEELLDEGLGIPLPLGVELDLEPLMRMDAGKQADVHTKLTGGGIETPNEGRLAFNLPPLEGGDTVYMQQQDIPLSEASKGTKDSGAETGGAIHQSATGGSIQQEALNGAQVTALQGIIFAVAAGQLDAETAEALIKVAFPLVTDEQIASMLANSGSVDADDIENPAAPAPDSIAAASKNFMAVAISAARSEVMRND